jgi:hypothetical protein
MITPFFELGAGAALMRSGVQHSCGDSGEPMGPVSPSDDDSDAFSAALDNGDAPIPLEGDDEGVSTPEGDEAEAPVTGKEKKSKKGKSGKSGKGGKSCKGKKSKKDKGDAADTPVTPDDASDAPSDVPDMIGCLQDDFNQGLDDVLDNIFGLPEDELTPPPADAMGDNVNGPVTGPVAGPDQSVGGDVPPVVNNEPLLVNTVAGGTGQPHLDMDAVRPGTQINVVLDESMAQADRENVFEALSRWSDASEGELEFSVFNEGEQPGGEDYISLKTVPPDDTGKSGIADVGRSPDGVTEMEFEAGSGLNIVMHEFGHTLGLGHGDGVQKAVDPTTEFSEQNLADLTELYPNIG